MNRGGLVYNKIRFSAAVILLYLLGKKIPIPWVVAEAPDMGGGMLGFLRGMLGTSAAGSSVLDLGLQPYITASIFTQVYVTVFKKDKKDYSQTRLAHATKGLALIIAVPQAFSSAARMRFVTVTGVPVPMSFALTVMTLTAGAFIVVWLSERIQARGLGGQSLLIMFNMLDNYRSNAWAILQGIREQAAGSVERMALLAVLLAVLVIAVMALVVMCENAEIRIPVHRGIMNNTLTEVDYIAVKVNPAGSMPVMYVMTAFSLPYYILRALSMAFPIRPAADAYEKLLALDSWPGLFVFLVFLWALTVLIAGVTVNPDDIAENLQKQGDYILGIPAGRKTRRILRRDVTFTAVLSAFLVSLAVGVPIAVRIAVHGSSPVYMLPMNLFLVVSIFIRIYDEARVLHLVEDYEPFL